MERFAWNSHQQTKTPSSSGWVWNSLTDGGAGFQPIDSGPHGEGGGFKGLVDVGDVEGDLNDSFHK